MPAKQRGYRQYPQAARVFSTNFPLSIERQGGCFVPLSDFRVLENKYIALASRMKREYNRNKPPE